jgi:CHAT domain-containing protein
MLIRLVLTTALTSSLTLVYAACPQGNAELAQGFQAANLYNWYAAAPHFHQAQQVFTQCGEERHRLLASVGDLRATMDQRNLGELSTRLGTLLNSPIAQHDPTVRLWIYIAKGDVDNELHYPTVARRDWEAVKALARVTHEEKWIYRAEGELAIPAFYLGDVALSRKLVTEALTAATDAQDYASEVRLLTHIGTVYEMWQQYDNGLERLNKALHLAEAHPEIGYPVAVQEGRIMGLMGLQHINEAERLAQEVVAIVQQQNRRLWEAETRVELASIYRAKQDTEAAIRELQKAVELAQAGQYQHSLANAEFELADLYRSLGRITEAETYATRAVQATHDSGIISDLPIQLQVLAALKAAEGKYQAADQLYRKAEDEVDAQLALAAVSARPLLLRAMSTIYTQHFALVAEHLPDVNAVYSIVERVRGRSLADLLRTGILPNTPEAEAVEREISNLRLKLATAKSETEIANLRDQIFITQHKRWLNTSEVNSLRRKPEQILPLAAVERSLQPSELLLEYVETSSSVYVLAITTHNARCVRLGPTQDMTAAAERFITAVKAKQSGLAEGTVLYNLILGSLPELNQYPNLIVVPDGELYAVPFPALVNQQGKRLLQTHTVVRASSASTHVILQRRPQRPVTGGLLAVGGVTYNADITKIAKLRGYESETLENLPGSEEEVTAAVAALRSEMKSDQLMKEAATESAFKADHLAERAVIHLAVHGTSNPKNADKAALIFLSDPASNEDGLLEVPAIIRLPLRSDLVVLSACETATGMVQGEEGVANLSRAFLLAGTHTVVATLWKIDDVFSAALMKEFYAGLANGHSKAEALVHAQRAILQRFPQAVPYHWAGFVIEGAAHTPLPQQHTKQAVNAREGVQSATMHPHDERQPNTSRAKE